MSTTVPSRQRLFARRGATTLAGVLAITLLASACSKSSTPGGSGSSESSSSSSSGTAAGGTIKVGVLSTTTGALSTYGIAEKQGIEVAFDNIDAAGGINGQKVEAVYYDTAGDTATAVTVTNRMIQQDHVSLVLDASSSSGVGLAVKPVVASAGLVMITAGAAADLTSPVSASKTTFGTTLSTDIVATKMVDFLKGRGVTSIGLLSSSDGYGKAGAASLQTAAKADNIKVQAIEYDPAATDLTSQIRQLQTGGNGAFIDWTSGPTGVVFFKNAKSLNLDKSGPVLASFTFSNPALMKQASTAGDGVLVAGIKATLLSTLPDSDPQKATISKFSDELNAKFGVPATIYAAQAYDMVIVAQQGIAKAGTASADKLAPAIEGLTVNGIQGTYKYSDSDHRGLSTDNLEMMQWTNDKFVAVTK